MTSGRLSSVLPQPCLLACATIHSHFGSRNSAAKESASSSYGGQCLLSSLHGVT